MKSAIKIYLDDDALFARKLGKNPKGNYVDKGYGEVYKFSNMTDSELGRVTREFIMLSIEQLRDTKDERDPLDVQERQ